MFSAVRFVLDCAYGARSNVLFCGVSQDAAAQRDRPPSHHNEVCDRCPTPRRERRRNCLDRCPLVHKTVLVPPKRIIELKLGVHLYQTNLLSYTVMKSSTALKRGSACGVLRSLEVLGNMMYVDSQRICSNSNKTFHVLPVKLAFVGMSNN